MEEKGLGWLDVEIIKKVEDAYVNMGLLENEVGIETMVTNEWVQELE